MPLGAFPEELTERLSVVAAAEEARLWHRLQPFLLRPYVPPKVSAFQPCCGAVCVVCHDDGSQ